MLYHLGYLVSSKIKILVNQAHGTTLEEIFSLIIKIYYIIITHRNLYMFCKIHE